MGFEGSVGGLAVLTVLLWYDGREQLYGGRGQWHCMANNDRTFFVCCIFSSSESHCIVIFLF